ncbi:MAG: glutamyl-tRNA reductase [Bacillales bacterium]|nr:glutamyl-tRNA reductase [Bacillales bacterium]
MHVLMIGLNHQSAPVEIREKLSFHPDELADAMVSLSNERSILEAIIVSTCNRMEVYAVVDRLNTGRFYVKNFLAKWFHMTLDVFTPYLTIMEMEEAVRHLFRTTCGLNSMVIGETQILGQIRTSFLIAQKYKTSGTVFNELFKQVVTFAKKVHSDTKIGENAVSVSYAAVELAKQVYGSLSQCHLAIFGAGKMGELALQNLSGKGIGSITVINRTFQKAQEMAERFHGRAQPIEALESVMEKIDILISSTGATHFVITPEMVENAQKKRGNTDLFMIDIAVPRDIDPQVGDILGVHLYDIDDLKEVVDSNLNERKREAEKIEDMIDVEIEKFFTWIGMIGLIPIISALKNKARDVQIETMKSIERKMPDLTAREKKILNKHTQSIVNQLLRDPILTVKELAGKDDREASLNFFIQVFNLHERVENEKKILKKYHRPDTHPGEEIQAYMKEKFRNN